MSQAYAVELKYSPFLNRNPIMFEIHNKIKNGDLRKSVSQDISTFSLLAFLEIVPCECFTFLWFITVWIICVWFPDHVNTLIATTLKKILSALIQLAQDPVTLLVASFPSPHPSLSSSVFHSNSIVLYSSVCDAAWKWSSIGMRDRSCHGNWGILVFCLFWWFFSPSLVLFCGHRKCGNALDNAEITQVKRARILTLRLHILITCPTF